MKSPSRTLLDVYFGELKITKNDDGYYLEKSIKLGPYSDVTLCLENKEQKTSKKQFELFTLIQQNISHILTCSRDMYFAIYQTDIYVEFDMDMVVLNDSEANFKWELWLVKKKRFENCIIEFDNLTPYHISFSA
jgi:hypothetical protein